MDPFFLHYDFQLQVLCANQQNSPQDGLDYLPQLQSARAARVDKTHFKRRKDSNLSQQSGDPQSQEQVLSSSSNTSNNISAGKVKSGGALKGSGASLNSLMPKTSGEIRMTL